MTERASTIETVDVGDIELRCGPEELAAIACDASYLIRAKLDREPMDAQQMALTIASAIQLSVMARDRTHRHNDMAQDAVLGARELHRRAAMPRAHA